MNACVSCGAPASGELVGLDDYCLECLYGEKFSDEKIFELQAVKQAMAEMWPDDWQNLTSEELEAKSKTVSERVSGLVAMRLEIQTDASNRLRELAESQAHITSASAMPEPRKNEGLAVPSDETVERRVPFAWAGVTAEEFRKYHNEWSEEDDHFGSVIELTDDYVLRMIAFKPGSDLNLYTLCLRRTGNMRAVLAKSLEEVRNGLADEIAAARPV